MDKQIPIYFDSVVIDSPMQTISTENSNVGRVKVRVFTKYGNRNGSYITEEVAEQLIASATSGIVPVVGFFDPQTQTWASHTGPTLANAYGYVEEFLGWEPFTDTDGVQREYAVFSVILFTKYFEEANKIIGQNQSMELDINSITGDWALIGDQEYFVYKTAKMLGFCVIGAHEPCFSVSSFFAKNDDIYKTQYEKFSSLLADLKTQGEETVKMTKGGEQPMDEFENKETVVEEETPVEETSSVEETPTEEIASFEEVETPVVEEEVTEPEVESTTEFDLLQQKYNELEAAYNELKANYEADKSNAAVEMDALRAENEKLQASISAYEAQAVKIEQEKKNALIEQYKNHIDEEEINSFRETINDYSYEELESKLAITFANKKFAGSEKIEKVPLPEPQESQFALLMKKYRKN